MHTQHKRRGGMVNYPLKSKHVSDLVCNGPVHQLLIRYHKDTARVSVFNPCREKLAKVCVSLGGSHNVELTFACLGRKRRIH